MNQKERNRLQHEVAKPAYDALMKYYPLTLEDLDGEIWKPIPTYEEFYHGSNFGRVKSLKYKTTRILKPGLGTTGYIFVNLSKNNKGKPTYIHRLVAELFIPNPEAKLQVNHRDGHKLNNYVGNLEWATREENMQHAYDTGLQSQGANRSDAKLTNEQVEYIRANPDHLTIYELAEKFDVHFVTISAIQLGKTYKNAGGSIRKAKPQKYTPRVPDEIRQKIRADWATGQYSQRALARKYGVSKTTILRIVHELN